MNLNKEGSYLIDSSGKEIKGGELVHLIRSVKEVEKGAKARKKSKGEDRIFTILIGEQVEPHREFIETYAEEVRDLDV